MNEAGNGGASAPQFEASPPPIGGEQLPGHSAEQAPAYQEAAANRLASPPSDKPLLPPIPATPTPIQPPAAQPLLPVQSTIVNTSALVAADTDHIEKQWIDAAKRVAAKTQADPYTQKNEMSKVKANYIQKRFQKTIKTDDTVVAWASC